MLLSPPPPTHTHRYDTYFDEMRLVARGSVSYNNKKALSIRD